MFNPANLFLFRKEERIILPPQCNPRGAFLLTGTIATNFPVKSKTEQLSLSCFGEGIFVTYGV